MKFNPSFRETAVRLARIAANEVNRSLHQPYAQERKADRSLVTDVDRRVDEILREGLVKAFPGHTILTEESGLSGPKDSEYVWMIDPLDGTRAFVKGIPGFSVMVGLLHQRRPILGVVVDPMEERLYEAMRGEGAFQTYQGKREQIRVSTRDRFDEMPLIVSTGFPEEKMKRFRESFYGPLATPINSVGIKVGLVVRQVADIYLSHHSVHYWDTCAPQAILEEAGGMFTRLDGTALQYDLAEGFSHEALTLATNGQRHADCVRIFSSGVYPKLFDPQ